MPIIAEYALNKLKFQLLSLCENVLIWGCPLSTVHFHSFRQPVYSGVGYAWHQQITKTNVPLSRRIQITSFLTNLFSFRLVNCAEQLAPDGGKSETKTKAARVSDLSSAARRNWIVTRRNGGGIRKALLLTVAGQKIAPRRQKQIGDCAEGCNN